MDLYFPRAPLSI